MNKRIEWIDTTKVVTMILVVLGHCAYYNIVTLYGGIHYLSDDIEVSETYNLLKELVDSIYTFHMPLFMALSGMCYYVSQSKNACIINLMKDKAIRLLLPFVVVSLFLSIPLKYLSGYWIESENVLTDIFLGQILLLGNSHLWFIVSLFWVFLLFYIVRNLINNIYLFWIVLLLLSWIGLYIDHRTNCLGLPAAIKHLFFFALGFYTLNWLDRIKLSAGQLTCLILLFVVTNILYNSIYKSLIGIEPSQMLSPIFFTFFAILGCFITIQVSKRVSNGMYFAGGGAKCGLFLKKILMKYTCILTLLTMLLFKLHILFVAIAYLQIMKCQYCFFSYDLLCNLSLAIF